MNASTFYCPICNVKFDTVSEFEEHFRRYSITDTDCRNPNCQMRNSNVPVRNDRCIFCNKEVS